MKYPILAFLFLSACSVGPSQGFDSVPAKEFVVDGTTFDVRIAGLYADARRVGPAPMSQLSYMGQRGAIAIEQVSQCKTAEVFAEFTRVLATLDCGEGPPVPVSAQKAAPSYHCYETTGIGGDTYTMCDPV